MIAILLAPVYLLANYYLLRRVMGWVKAWFPFFRTARHWALPVAVQAFLACSIVIAFFLPEGRARRVMKLIGNYWLGVLLDVCSRSSRRTCCGCCWGTCCRSSTFSSRHRCTASRAVCARWSF